jgi:hypothetical protein
LFQGSLKVEPILAPQRFLPRIPQIDTKIS